jgi:hypothetical protein
MSSVARGVASGTSTVLKERDMMASGTHKVALFVARSCPQHWIVRDPDGNFWILPPGEKPWEQRQPFHPTAETELEPVPGHYRYMLSLPF